MNQTMTDYIVVGGGAGGCAVAGRLSEDPNVSVTVLEAGGKGDSHVVKTPFGVVAMLPTKLNNWAFETVPQPGLNGRRGYQPRGKMLGGSSGLNAMIYARGHRQDYDEWAALGNPGWSFDEVLPYFIRSENNATFGAPWHGQNGPLRVSELQSDNPFQSIFKQAAQQAGFKLNDDFNGAEQEGLGTYQVTQHNGERWSAARAYLHPHMGQRSNLVGRNRLLCHPHPVRRQACGGRADDAERPEQNPARALRSVARRRRLAVTAIADALWRW